MMLRSMLVGLDGSSYSRAAVELGIRWARPVDAFLVGLGIVDEPGIRGGQMIPLGAGHYKAHADEARVHQARVQVEQYLEQFALRCQEAGVAAKLLQDVGTPDEQILLQAQRFDLILLGQRSFFCSNSQEIPCGTLRAVLRNASRPVVTVPEALPPGSAIVAAYDGSLQAARALQVFEATGLGRGQPVHIVSVSSEKEEAARWAARAEEFLRLHEVVAQVHALASSTAPAEVLLDLARQLNAELIVMGAYGQSTLREFFLGSVTRTLLAETTMPLFLYH